MPVREEDISFYSRTHPLENPDIEMGADQDWAKEVIADDVMAYRKEHHEIIRPHLAAAAVSGDVEPTGTPDSGKDVTEEIRHKARELGFGEVGFTKYDRRYTYGDRKGWVKYEHAICLALEQDYWQTQTMPSLEGEFAHYGTYQIEAKMAEALAEFIRTLGYRVQMHLDTADAGAMIPMFVNAGLGQLGANGQLLMPHFGSRARLTLITTDAIVTYDEPVDYGMVNLCQECQVCVNRCPGRALIRDKVWWRGAKKNKVIYERCRPMMSYYDGCAACMKVCPVQRYGMKPVLEHYVETGEILGKGTENLEGYNLRGKGYYGAGELPTFSPEMFDIPNRRPEQLVFDQLKEKVEDGQTPSPEEMVEFVDNLKEALHKSNSYYDYSA